MLLAAASFHPKVAKTVATPIDPDGMLRLLVALTIPVFTYAAVQCYVGQKLFSYESNNAICARFIPYHCAAGCEWRRNCSTHASFGAFHGRRTFVSGLLINSKSLMVLCCASLATRLETDDAGREKCVWRETESIAVLGPSIRTNPVLAPNHYIRDVRMDRDGTSRVDVALEICQYLTEREHCTVDRMDENERKRFGIIQQKMETNNIKLVAQKANEAVKTTGDDKKAGDCEALSQSECGKEVQSRIQTCCKDQPNCDNDCIQSLEKTLMDEAPTMNKGCTVHEVRLGLECFVRKINNRTS
ncbi:hypothetical protein OESDEN_00491 [Oesophagostomum dentatum]|uniref:Uncharacterized protein n=1 Tax=Oesophagostomum dentatum TaxID=61180 RepID=A0A0B1TVN8_OESDE|nr:hypothetical protein OESDEN_00491 [Oesophagostomum dentatum]